MQVSPTTTFFHSIILAMVCVYYKNAVAPKIM